MCLLRNGGFRRGYVGVGGSVTVSNQITSFFLFCAFVRTVAKRCLLTVSHQQHHAPTPTPTQSPPVVKLLACSEFFPLARRTRASDARKTWPYTCGKLSAFARKCIARPNYSTSGGGGGDSLAF